MEEFVEFKDEFFAIEEGIVEGWRIVVCGVVEGREFGEGGEVIAVIILEDP